MYYRTLRREESGGHGGGPRGGRAGDGNLQMPDAQHDAPGAADTPIPPAPVCWLSTQLVNEDALADADVPTLRALKGVSPTVITPSLAARSMTSIDRSIELPAGLTSLGASTFSGCSSMRTSIALPAGLTSPPLRALGGWCAFAGCSSLTSIELPAGFDDRILRSASVPPGAILRFASAFDVD